MATVSGNVAGKINFTQTNSTGLPSTLQLNASVNPAATYGNTGSTDNTDLVYYAELTLAASATTLDLSALTDVFGAAVNFARIRELVIINKSLVNANVLLVEPGTTNGWTSFMATGSVLTVEPSTTANPTGGHLVIGGPNTSGYTVGSTNKTLKLDPGAVTIVVDLLIAGAVA